MVTWTRPRPFLGIFHPCGGTYRSRSTKFKDCSFIHSRNTEEGLKFLKRSRDPGHAPFRGYFSLLRWDLPQSIQLLKEFKIYRQTPRTGTIPCTVHRFQYQNIACHAQFVAWQAIKLTNETRNMTVLLDCNTSDDTMAYDKTSTTTNCSC